MLKWLQKRLTAWSPEHKKIIRDFPGFEELVMSRIGHEDRQGTVVGFYTKDSIYELEKNRLQRSLDLLNLRYDLSEIENQQSWVRNAGMKPSVLVKMREKHQGPLLYVDVDAVFHRNSWPHLLEQDCDLAVYFEPEGNLLSGTLFIGDTPAAKDLLSVWEQACRDNPEEWDQRVLQKIIADDQQSKSPRYRVERLPVSYCWVFDKINNEPESVIYIEHLQASREKKKRKRLFNRKGKGLTRRDDRIKEIEKVLFQ